MAFIGLVIGMPFGSVLSNHSIGWLIAANMMLSAVGMFFRLVSARTLVARPVAEQNEADVNLLGQKTTFARFIADLVRTSPASPAVSFITQFGGVMGGMYVYLWIAQSSGWPAGYALGLVISLFGIGATIGPHAAPLLRRYLSIESALLTTYLAAIGVLKLTLIAITAVTADHGWTVGLAYVFLIAITARSRDVLTTTLRQQSFRGSRFTAVMSWSFSLAALADIIANWSSVALHVDRVPQIGLGVYLIALIIATIAVIRHRQRSRDKSAPRPARHTTVE